MIIIKLMGGLGNQLFQYAAAENIAKHNKTELLIDTITGFEKDPYRRSFVLNNFCIKARDADINLINSFVSNNGAIRYFQTKIRKILPMRYPRYITERFYHFDQEMANLQTNKDVYLEGYFQSEKYFLKICDDIRTQFELKNIPDVVASKYLIQINNSESVSLHVRKYDDARAISSTNIYDTCNVKYYQNAIRYIKSKLSNPVFFIFSDDIEWTKKNIRVESQQVEYIGHNNAGNSQEDLRLMKACKHNIIANSSFSWWGAWLNKNQEKIVIAPKIWLNKKNTDFRDVVPTKWVQL